MLYIITGPSGAGKTAVGEYLKQKGFQELISHTTRAPRPGEVHGVAYHFVSEEEFEETKKVEESHYAGNRYGVSLKEVAEKVPKGMAFAVTDLRGAASFKRIYGTGVRVLYIDSSPRYFRARMKERGDPPQSIRRRIRTYRREKEKRSRLPRWLRWAEADAAFRRSCDSKRRIPEASLPRSGPLSSHPSSGAALPASQPVGATCGIKNIHKEWELCETMSLNFHELLGDYSNPIYTMANKLC